MAVVYEIGDARPIIKVCFDREGWEWFRDLVHRELSPRDTFLQDVDDADAYLALDEQDSD